jgi:hypothetical protein
MVQPGFAGVQWRTHLGAVGAQHHGAVTSCMAVKQCVLLKISGLFPGRSDVGKAVEYESPE